MGWIISVGRAGARNKQSGGQIMSVSVDVQGVPSRIQVFRDTGHAASRAVGTIPARQAHRVWRNVLSTLTDTE